MLATRRLAGLLVASIALVAACSSSGATSAPPTQAAATPPPSAATGGTTVTIGMASSSLGNVLVGPNGLTLYVHAGDTATSSACNGACATAWPPLAVASGQTAVLASGITGTLGTLTRTDGTVQVTFDGLPLYGWKNDKAPGDVTGQNVNGFTVATPGGTAPSPAATGGY